MSLAGGGQYGYIRAGDLQHHNPLGGGARLQGLKGGGHVWFFLANDYRIY